MGSGHALNDLILRFANEIKESREIERGAVFTEDQRRSGVGDSHLVWVSRVFIESFKYKG